MDVDAYGDKQGAETLARFEKEYGPLGLELTDRSSAREEPSGIYLFRCPEGWRGLDVGGIEWIHHTWRYANVEPSVHPDTGDMYRWHYADRANPHWRTNFENLPKLPQGIIDNEGHFPEETAEVVRDHAGEDVLTEGEPCDFVLNILKGFQTSVDAGDSRHSTMVRIQKALFHKGSEGHPGVKAAVDTLESQFLAAFDKEDDRTPGPNEFSDAKDGGLKMVPDRQRDTDPCDDGAIDPDLVPAPGASATGGDRRHLPQIAEWVWTARPVLGHIQQAAHSRCVSADVTLVAVLCRIAAARPPLIQGEAGKGGLSLNLLMAPIGPPGSGKSTATASLPRELLPIRDDFDFSVHSGIGTGEGAIEVFQGYVDVETESVASDGTKKTKTSQVKKQVRENAMFIVDEGSVFNTARNRTDSTLGSHLSSMFYGLGVASPNAQESTKRKLDMNSYSMSAIINLQNEIAGPMLGEQGQGMPQRFVFLSANDRNIPYERVAFPGPLRGVNIGPDSARRKGMGNDDDPFRSVGDDDAHYLRLPDDIAEEIHRKRVARGRGDAVADTWEAHKDAIIVKLACLLAMLDGRGTAPGEYVTREDFEIATAIWDASAAVRDRLLADIAEDERASREAKDRKQVEMAGLKEAAKLTAGTDVERVKQKILRRLERVGGDVARRTLYQNAISKGDRKYFDSALDMAVGQELVEVDGTSVRLVGG
ncbi:hypothetical protein [Lipingzhangella halophila]|nr:hypothetical protein [Lipingzhangella halophila]